jgi:hypothetical protein
LEQIAFDPLQSSARFQQCPGVLSDGLPIVWHQPGVKKADADDVIFAYGFVRRWLANI